MLTSITIRNFKSYREATLPLAPLTLLIGANASGKSNAIEALRILSWLARGRQLYSIQSAIQSSDLIVRGSVRDLFFPSGLPFGFNCSIESPPSSFLTEEDSIEYLAITIASNNKRLEIIDERLTWGGRKFPLYELKEVAASDGSEVRVVYDNFSRGGVKPQIICSNQQAIFTQLQSAARFQKGHDTAQAAIPLATQVVAEVLATIVFLDPEPRAMRGYVHGSELRPREDGSNMSAMLKALWDQEENRERLVAFIRSLPEQNIARLEFITTERSDVMIRLVETFGGKERAVDAPLLSDGTLRVLAIAATLMSAERGSMVVIEEIDNGVHPSRAGQLMSSIQEVAKERDLRVLLTTHNPALMDALPLAALADVVFCYRDPEGGDSRLVRLSDLADYPQLMAQGELGDLVTAGIVDRTVKQQSDPEEKRRRALEWLDGLKASGAA